MESYAICCIKLFQGYTALHLATMYNHNDVVLRLVDDYGKLFFCFISVGYPTSVVSWPAQSDDHSPPKRVKG